MKIEWESFIDGSTYTLKEYVVGIVLITKTKDNMSFNRIMPLKEFEKLIDSLVAYVEPYNE